MKLTIVGGGSTYTPELVDGLVRMQRRLKVTELALHAVSPERLDILGAMSRRMLRSGGHPATVTTHTGIAGAVEGAEVVLVQLRVGGQAARLRDETIPLTCDCLGQETPGAGGLAKALRTVPVMLEVAGQVRAANPTAWLIDFTNPVGIVTRALLDAGHRAIGLCNVAIGFQRRFAEMLDVEPSSVVLDHVGLNHLTWERAAYVDGVDRLPELMAAHLELLARGLEMPPEILRTLGCVPSYYLRYFYCHDEVVREEIGVPTRGERVAEIEAELLRMYRDVTLSTKPE